MLGLGYILALLMGMVLGLLGAGGSILTVPILVYCFALPASLAISYSLCIVGSTALFGAWNYYSKKLVDIRAAILFAIPATLLVTITRVWLLPAIPENVGALRKDELLLLLFSGLMLAAGAVMLKHQDEAAQDTAPQKGTRSIPKLMLGSAAVGMLTGLIGAGGGFLIVPTLIYLFGLSMKVAVGTSLLVIAANALTGFVGDIASGVQLENTMLIGFLVATLIGMKAGIILSARMNTSQLKRLFAMLVIVLGLCMAADTLFIA